MTTITVFRVSTLWDYLSAISIEFVASIFDSKPEATQTDLLIKLKTHDHMTK